MSNNTKEALVWISIIGIMALTIFLALLYFPRLQYQYCFKQNIKSYQQETNFKEQNALERCDKWLTS